MAIYAANNLFRAISKYAPSGGALLGGIIANGLTHPYAASLIDDFAQRTGTRTVEYIPRSPVVAAERAVWPDGDRGHPDLRPRRYLPPAGPAIAAGHPLGIPVPLSVNDLRDWARAWAIASSSRRPGL